MLLTLAVALLLPHQTVPALEGAAAKKPWLDLTGVPDDIWLDSDDSGRIVSCVSRTESPLPADIDRICREALARNAKARRLTPIDRSKWLDGVSIRNGSGSMAFALSVDAKGQVTRCETRTSSGNAQTDQQVCDILSRRARFIAARTSEGIPQPATYRNKVQW